MMAELKLQRHAVEVRRCASVRSTLGQGVHARGFLDLIASHRDMLRGAERIALRKSPRRRKRAWDQSNAVCSSTAQAWVLRSIRVWMHFVLYCKEGRFLAERSAVKKRAFSTAPSH